MSARPDMARGTSSAAVAINSSYRGVEAPTRRDTPLGPRWSVYAITATGQRKEIAMLRSEKAAARVEDYLRRAIVSLDYAAKEIAADREG